MKKLARTVLLVLIIFCTSCAKDVVEFNPDIQYGSFTDARNGEVYKTVQIGDQTWMAENMRSFSDDPNEVNCCSYGKLYRINDAMEVCPEGWHLPDTTDWQILIDFIGGNDHAGGKLKEAGYTHWEAPNKGATNSSGFTGLGAGSANYSNGLKDRKRSAEFWTSTPYYSEEWGNTDFSYYYISLGYSSEKVGISWSTEDIFDFSDKKSIRCIKN